MGFFSSFFEAANEVADAATPWATVEAEAAGQAPTRGGVSDKASGTAADGLGEAEGEVEDENKQTPDDREVSSVKTVSGKEASGNDSSNKYGPAGHHDDYHGLAGAAKYGPKDMYTDKGNSEDEDEEEEEEEEEEDIVDPKEVLEQECIDSKECAGAKHHYDECAERVMAAKETEQGTKEDCVEEFFHLMHCATTCAAPKLWAQLK